MHARKPFSSVRQRAGCPFHALAPSKNIFVSHKGTNCGGGHAASLEIALTFALRETRRTISCSMISYSSDCFPTRHEITLLLRRKLPTPKIEQGGTVVPPPLAQRIAHQADYTLADSEPRVLRGYRDNHVPSIQALKPRGDHLREYDVSGLIKGRYHRRPRALHRSGKNKVPYRTTATRRW